jgi:hypothetical protein
MVRQRLKGVGIGLRTIVVSASFGGAGRASRIYRLLQHRQSLPDVGAQFVLGQLIGLRWEAMASFENATEEIQ